MPRQSTARRKRELAAVAGRPMGYMQLFGCQRTPILMAKRKKSPTTTQARRNPGEIAELIERCRQGDAASAEAVFARYVKRLTALALSRLSRKLASRLDASDIVMSAYRSFFVGLRDRGFEIADESGLWQLLVQITLRKLFRQAAKHRAGKRAIGRDVRLDQSYGSIELAGREPLPEEAAALADEVEFLLEQLPASARRIIELRLQGLEIAEIAADAQVNERTVRRWLQRARSIIVARKEQPAGDRSSANGRVPTTRNPVSERKSNHRVVVAQRASPIPALNYSDYLLQAMIGAGASGKIYRAHCRRDGRTYALKFLRKEFLINRDAVRRFEDEFSLAAKLSHPHIMPVLGWGRTLSGGYFFAMELAAGDLQSRLDKRRPTVRQAIEWIHQAALGVQYAHERGIIHRDLKPGNLLLAADGRVLVSDFGLACNVDALPGVGQFAGTPAFMAPEQIWSSGADVSPQTDIYGLGATLYALLTGRPPFAGDRASEVLSQIVSTQIPVRPGVLRSRVPADVEQLCLRCLAKNPSERFESVGEMVAALEGVRLSGR